LPSLRARAFDVMTEWDEFKDGVLAVNISRDVIARNAIIQSILVETQSITVIATPSTVSAW